MINTILRTIKWLMLVPTITPILSGTISGILWGPWSRHQVSSNWDQYLLEAKEIRSDWGIGGGAPSFRQFEDKNNDFRLERVNSNDWLEKLGFILPWEYSESPARRMGEIADLNTLMVDVTGEEGRKKEKWLFLTSFAWLRFLPENEAFDEVVRRAYVHPTLNRTSLHFAECSGTAGFLCGIWATRAPALVHFLVEDDPVGAEDISGFTYNAPLHHLRPVTVRLIEFPLKNEYTGLSLSTLPSEKEQMLAIMSGDRLYEQFDVFAHEDQIFKRFWEYMDDLRDSITVLHYLHVVDRWMLDNVAISLGIEDTLEVLWSVVLMITMNAATLTNMAIDFGDEWFGKFVARPTKAEWIVGGDREEATPWNLWDGVMGAFWEHVDRRMAEERSSSKEPEDQSTVTAA